jgi:hypothetical protein
MEGMLTVHDSPNIKTMLIFGVVGLPGGNRAFDLSERPQPWGLDIEIRLL